MKLLLLVGCAALALVGCTPSETACNLMSSSKRVFDAEVAAGTVDTQHVPTVNALYESGRRVCDAPAGEYDQAMIIDIATDAYIAIRAATRDNSAAYQAMRPSLQKLEYLLKEAKQ